MQCQLREAVADICRRRGRPLDPPSRGPVERTGGRWGIGPFYVSCGDGSGDVDRHSVATQATTAYNFETETTYDNLYRLLRAMQLSRPILLEGSPGVGKTTLIEAMSRAVGKEFVRINLSDQTDMMDLLGANLPSPEGDAGEFVWSDGPLLQAMKTGSWVLLDELNLAGQSILEGLNALLDHRGEIFVPELNTVVKCAPGFRLFGAQNPVQEGGGRKGLPKSFLNRFIRVRISGFSFQDLLNISSSVQPGIPEPVIRAMTDCLWQCASRANYRGQTGLDFNLRDLLRWCKLVQRKLDECPPRSTMSTMVASTGTATGATADVTSEAVRWSRFYGNMLLAERMRSPEDRRWIESLLDERLVSAAEAVFVDRFEICPSHVTIGNVRLPRKSWVDALRGGSVADSLPQTQRPSGGSPPVPHSHLPPLLSSSADAPPMIHASKHAVLKSYFGVQESLAESVKNNWLSILVGPTGTGRLSSVAALGHLLGKRVVEIPMHPGIDISDLLGGFEQVDADRESLAVLTGVKAFLRSLAVVALGEGQSQSLAGLRDLWHDLLFDDHTSQRDRDGAGPGDHATVQRRARTAVATMADNRDLFSEMIGGLSEESGKMLAADLDALQRCGERLLARGARAAGKFEWVDGTLTRCILDGSWVVLRDANLCNPSVLDRLNPLFEPGGFISLNECGSTEEGARTVVPHPEFRMFITYDPLGGEISRAMRNRGIEINMAVDASTGLPSRRLGTGTSPGVSDVVAVMVANAVPGPIAQELARRWLMDANSMDGGIPADKRSIHYLAKWSGTIDALVSSGLSLDRAVQVSYRQCFGCDVPTDLIVDTQCFDCDVSAFMYPSLEDVAGGSPLDGPMADWGFFVELGKGSTVSSSTSFDDYMALVEQHGALVAANVAGFDACEGREGGGGGRRTRVRMMTDAGEDVMNAALAICQGSFASSALVSDMVGKIPASLRSEEAAAWKLYLADIGPGGSNPRTSWDSCSIRVSLESCRLVGLAEAVPDSLSECVNLLEASAWCHRNPFSQDQQVRDAALLKWLWAALQAVYDAVCPSRSPGSPGSPGSFGSFGSSAEVCDTLSLVRRVMLLQGVVGTDRERLAHAWQRLVNAIGQIDRKTLTGATGTLVEKVSGLLRGPANEDAPSCAGSFVEAVGRPLVALNAELHSILQRCHAFAQQLRVDRDRLDAYRTSRAETDDMSCDEEMADAAGDGIDGDAEMIENERGAENGSGNGNESAVLVAMDPGLRSDLLEAMRIVLAGSLMDLDSLPSLLRVVDRLNSVMQLDALVKKSMSNADAWVAQGRLLRHDGALEQLGELEELVVRRQEVQFALRLSEVAFADGDAVSSERLHDCIRDARTLAEGVVGAITALPSRAVSDGAH